jgi:hypothetical protein
LVCKGQLSNDEVAAVSRYLAATNALPEDIFTTRGIGPGFGLLHPAGDAHRRLSIEMLRQFELKIRAVYGRFESETAWLDELL